MRSSFRLERRTQRALKVPFHDASGEASLDRPNWWLQTPGVKLGDRLARLDDRVVPQWILQGHENSRSRAADEITVGAIGIVGSTIAAIATGHWGLLGIGAVFLIAGLVRWHYSKPPQEPRPREE